MNPIDPAVSIFVLPSQIRIHVNLGDRKEKIGRTEEEEQRTLDQSYWEEARLRIRDVPDRISVKTRTSKGEVSNVKAREAQNFVTNAGRLD